VPPPDGVDVTGDLAKLGEARDLLVRHDRAIEEARLAKTALVARRDQFLATGAVDEAEALSREIARADADLAAKLEKRSDILGHLTDLSNGLVVAFTPEQLTATLDGVHPVCLLPVRIETRFASPTKLLVRVFPDHLQVNGHDTALTADEQAAGQWYWTQRWAAGLDDTAAATAAWKALAARFRPGRASYVVKATNPTNTPSDGAPAFPQVPSRASTWSRAPLATALPDRFCVVGLRNADGQWTESFRTWGGAVPDQLAVGPDPHTQEKADQDGALPVDEGIRWMREPEQAKIQGVLLEVEHPSLAQGVDRLVVLGVDWTKSPDESAVALGALLDAQRYAGHLGFVGQGTPTNNTSDSRSGFSSAADAEAAALDPVTAPGPGDEWSAGARLSAALGLPASALHGIPGADLREHAWASALTDALWRATAGYYVSDLLDPLAKDDPGVDANLREFVRRNVFACGPLPAVRVGAQPYGVLPVVSSKSYQPGGQAERLVHRVATLMRQIVSPALPQIPHLGRAGEDQDLDTLLLALLQRTPVPWTFRFRPLVGPVERKNLGINWERANVFQHTWTTAMWAGLHVVVLTRLNELTAGKDHPLTVPLVTKPGEQNPTGYLSQIADLIADPHGRTALNLREDSIALLEALAACSAVHELDRCALAVIRDRLQLAPAALAQLPALRNLAVPTPSSMRVEATPTVPAAALDFRSGRQLADAVVPQVSGSKPMGEFITGQFASKLPDLTALLSAPTDPFYWLGNHQAALRELATAPASQLEWAFRGFLDLFSTRLDAWFTGLATARLADHRGSAPSGLHLGCWGFVEDLRRDVGPGAESVGFVHAPSLAHATSTALLRNGRLANRGDGGAVFDLEVTSDRVRRATWLLDGVAQGQSLAALIGYRLERGLREAGLAMMRYQMPMRRIAPMRGPDIHPDQPVEALTARDVVDGVALLDRWRSDPDGVLADIAKQAGLASLPAADATKLRGVINVVFDSYDAVSDLLVAESVHQAAMGNLDRSGAALSAHDRHGRAPELDYVASPRSGHTVAHRVAIAVQDTALPAGWTRDARGNAEPMLDAWVARLLGEPSAWEFGATTTAADGTKTMLPPLSLADLGLGPLSVTLATQRPGQGRPSELEQRLGLAFAARLPADPTVSLELLADPPSATATGGLALLETLGEWVARLTACSPIGAADFVPGTNVSGGLTAAGGVDVAELSRRVEATRGNLTGCLAALVSAADADQRTKALLAAVPFDGPGAIPRVPINHPVAAGELAAQVTEVTGRLTALAKRVAKAVAEPLPAEPDQQVARHTTTLKTMLGSAQPVLPPSVLTAPASVTASLNSRADLLGGDPTAPASWLQRSALVRPELEAFAGLMMHAEATGADVPGQLRVIQLPHRPGAPWLARPFGDTGVPPHGSIGLVVHSFEPFDAGRAFAGLLVDSWTETIPADQETTAVAFHYDAPGAAPPQAVLLAVHPNPDPDAWSFDLLLETVNEAADLARLRMLSSAELAPMGTFLPALYLPDDYTHDVPSVSFSDLIKAAERADFLVEHPDVLGKA
jgi:hypothetical protein